MMTLHKAKVYDTTFSSFTLKLLHTVILLLEVSVKHYGKNLAIESYIESHDRNMMASETHAACLIVQGNCPENNLSSWYVHL